jgi:hypothetical protein
MDLNTYAKDQGSRTYGEPPYGHAEQSTLQAFAEKTNLDLAKAQELLRARGIAFQGTQQRIQDIAKQNRLTPQQVYLAMKAAEVVRVTSGGLPEAAAPGLGRKTLEEVCQDYQLDLTRVQSFLRARNMKVEANQSFRALAEANGTGPHELYALLRDGLR